MPRHDTPGPARPASGIAPQIRRAAIRISRDGMLVVALTLGALVACAPHVPSVSAAASAELDGVRFTPGAGADLPVNATVSANFRYRILPAETDLAGRRDAAVFAVLEARSGDDRTLFLDACGGDARRPLAAAAGFLSLTCAVSLPEPASDDEYLVLQVRIYQRTGQNRSVSIGSSLPVRMRRTRAVFTPIERVFMSPCPERAARADRDRAAVTVCRG